MRNSIHASITIVLMKSYSQTHADRDVRGLFIPAQWCFCSLSVSCSVASPSFKCPIPAAAPSSQQHAPTRFPPLALRSPLLQPARRGGCSDQKSAGKPVHVRRQQSGERKAPPTKISTRVKAEQQQQQRPGWNQLPSLREPDPRRRRCGDRSTVTRLEKYAPVAELGEKNVQRAELKQTCIPTTCRSAGKGFAIKNKHLFFTVFHDHNTGGCA